MTQDPAQSRSVLAQLVELAERLQASLGPGTELYTFIEALPSIELEWERMFRDLPGQAQSAFKDAGFPPCEQFSLDDVREIAETYTTKGSAAATTLIEQKAREVYASETCRNMMLANWARNPRLTNRLAIVREAFAASLAGHYNIAIPALLAQLEGLLADAFTHVGKMGGHKYRAYVERLAAQDEFLGTQLNEFVRTVILATFEHGIALNSDLSRHAILHGGDTTYGTERNAIRAIMLFDYVQELARPENG